jgi:hypothetical protein
MELQSLSLLLVLLVLLFGALYAIAQQRHRRRIGRERGRLWEDCVSLLDGARVRQDGIDFPRLEGYYHGHHVRLEAIADHIAFRKLPQLWLRATLRVDIPYRGVLDLLVRPENIEFYSPIWSLPETIDLPPGWPVHALARTDGAGDMPPLGVVGRHLGIFDDPRTKELLVTPRGVRLVYQLAQGQRAHYAVLRSVNFELGRADSHEVRRIVDAALAISEDLRTAGRKDTPISPIPHNTHAMPWPVLRTLGTPC